MSDLPAEGTFARPLRLDPWQRLYAVHWSSGRYGVLEITAPEGLTFLFGAYSPTGTLTGEFRRADIMSAIAEIHFDNPTLATLYDVTDFSYLIGTVVFPDRVPPDPFAYETIRASIHAPDRFVEVTDLRTLSNKEFPYQIGGWPTDGNWSDPAFPWENWSDGRPGYLPASSGSDPSAPGYYVNATWGLGEAYQTSEVKRSLRKYAWLLDFTKAEGRIGDGTVMLSISAPEHDDNLGGYTMQISLREFSAGGVFHVVGTSITAMKTTPPDTPLLPLLTQTRAAAYDQAGVIARITKAGFVE
jgi:hypothetical protein